MVSNKIETSYIFINYIIITDILPDKKAFQKEYQSHNLAFECLRNKPSDCCVAHLRDIQENYKPKWNKVVFGATSQ